MLDVAAIGELLIDFTHEAADRHGYPTLAAHPGGAPANFLAALAKYGAKTAMIGKVGDDAFGQLLRGTLAKTGIETRGVVAADDVFTTLAFVTLDGHGDRMFSFARKPGADRMLRFEEIDLSLIDDARVFHFGTVSMTHEPSREATCRAVAYAKDQGKLITFDPNLRKPLWEDMEDARRQMLWGLKQADIVKISDDETAFLFGLKPKDGAAYIRKEYGVKLVFVTCGGAGCYYENPVASGHVDGLRDLQVVDTTGAGDIFGGSAVWKLLQSKTAPQALTDARLQEITRFACAAAGLSTLRHGGISSVPELTRVNART